MRCHYIFAFMIFYLAFPLQGTVNLEDIFQNNRLSGNWSVFIHDLDQDSTIFEYNSQCQLLPASILKSITAAIALKELGLGYQFPTYFYLQGKIKESVLYGNLLVKGDKDPTWGANFLETKTSVRLNKIAKFLKDSCGISLIEGKIRTINKSTPFSWYGVGWDFDDLSNYYAPVLGDLSFNENITKLSLSPTKIKITPFYPYKFVRILDDSNLKILRKAGCDTIYIKGKRGYANKYLTVQYPELFFKENLKKVMQRTGIKIKEDSTINYDTQDINFCYPTYSDSLVYILKKMVKESNNFYAEMVFRKAIESYAYKHYDSLKIDLDTSRDYLKFYNAMLYNYFRISEGHIVDGSGLSRMNFVSSNMIIKVLNTMFVDPSFQIYLSFFARPGREGTIKERYLHSSLRENIFLKTGSMSGVHCVCGYLLTNSGKRLSFAFLNNYFEVFRGNIDDLFEKIFISLVEKY